MEYLWIGSNSDPLGQSKDQLESLKGVKICRKCGLNFSDEPLDVWMETELPNEAYSYFSNSDFKVFHIEFLHLVFGDNDLQYLPFGSVFQKGGIRSRDYLSLNMASRIFVRGSWAPRIGPTCKSCGRHRAITPQGGPLYLMDSAIPGRKRMYISQSGLPLIRDDLPYKFYKARWRHLILEGKVEVFDKSRDNLDDSLYSRLGRGSNILEEEVELNPEEYKPPSTET